MEIAVIEDLKQFIEATVSGHSKTLKTELKTELKMELKTEIVSELATELSGVEHRLGAKIDELSLSIAQAMDATNDEHQSRFDDHERRIVRLERSAT